MIEQGTYKKRGRRSVIAAVAIQLTLGTAYIWSVFQTGIAETIFDGNNAAAALTFSLLLALLTIGSVLGGRLTQKYSTRTVVFLGGLILSLGFFGAGFVTSGAPWLLWATYGIMGGLGMGFTYSPTIACAQKWFPHKKGLVTGIIVSALGFGGVIFTPIVEWFIELFGGITVGEQNTFMVLGGIFFVVCTIGCLFLKNPPATYTTHLMEVAPLSKKAARKAHIEELSPRQMLKKPSFYIITTVFMLACMGGLMMIAFAIPIANIKGLRFAAVGVLVVSMFNSLGRLLWGMISDKLGRKNTIIVLLSGTSVLSLLVTITPGYFIYVLIAFIGFFYGGYLSTFPSLTADLFGSKYVATNYGFVLLGFGIGAIVSSQIAGFFRNRVGGGDSIRPMFPAFIIASVCAGVGIVLMVVLKKIRKKQNKLLEVGN